MQDPHSRLIETAVRPLADNAEMKLAAIHELRLLEIPSEQAAENAITRWDTVDSRKRPPFWRIALCTLMIAVSLSVGFRNFGETVSELKWGNWLVNFSFVSPIPPPVPKTDREFTAEQKLLLFGDQTQSSLSEKRETLWRMHPENPAYFADYATAYLSDHILLPPDYLDIARRLAPHNSWFTYQAAAIEAGEALKRTSRRSRKINGKLVYDLPRSWEILDQARLDRSLELIHEAQTQPEWDDYSADMLRMRISLLPQHNFKQQMELLSVLAGGNVNSSIRLRIVADAISAKAWSLRDSGDEAGFRSLSTDAEHFLRGFTDHGTTTLVDGLIATVCASAISESLADAAEKLGLQEDAARWKKIGQSLNDQKEAKNSRKFIVDGQAADSERVAGSLLGGSLETVARQSAKQVPLTAADLEPARLFDHEILSRFLSYLSWIIMLPCLVAVAAYRFRVSTMTRRLASRMQQLLDSTDWAWLLGAGVILPFAFVMVINRLTPLGGRDIGVAGISLLLPTCHFLGLLILWWIVPPRIIRWRLSKRAGVFGFPKLSRMGWLTVFCAVAWVPFIGWAIVTLSFTGFREILFNEATLDTAFQSNSPVAFGIALAWLAATLLWLIYQATAALFSSHSLLLHRTTSSLILVPIFLSAMLLLAVAAIAFKAAEQHWYERETLSKADAQGPGWTLYESLVTKQIRQELRETLAPLYLDQP